MMKKGNYVSIASELLAHIVQVDPIRVAFSMTDRAYLDQLAAGPDSATTEQVARVRLPNGKLLSRLGRKDFADNQMNTDTGTMTMRYLFDNADGLLVPGGYVNILLGPEQRPMGLRIPQQALLQDRQGSYVLTLDGDGRVGTARVELGQSIETDRVVLDGLKPGDRVVVEGVQKVQPGMTNVVVVMESAQ
jgi:membrane fusion protein (multidrug efflux system)